MMNTIDYMQKFTQAASDNGEALKSIFDLSLRATQQMVALNGDFVRTFSGAGAESANVLDFDAQVSAQAQRLERSTEYFRDMNELCINTQAEIVRQSTQRMREVMDEAAEQFASVFRADRFDGADFAEMMSANLRTAGEAFERMLNTSREVSESNLAATMTALEPAAGSVRRKAANSARKAA